MGSTKFVVILAFTKQFRTLSRHQTTELQDKSSYIRSVIHALCIKFTTKLSTSLEYNLNDNHGTQPFFLLITKFFQFILLRTYIVHRVISFIDHSTVLCCFIGTAITIMLSINLQLTPEKSSKPRTISFI